MQQFERDYADLVKQVLFTGERRETRNGYTLSTFGAFLEVDCSETFPIIQGRKMYPKGVLGELAAMLRKPKCIEDFKLWGCNYWQKWSKPDGTINVDYGNAWFDFNGVDQIAQLKDKLRSNPTDRRMLITGWNPSNLDDLDLPCCHMLYQFYVDCDNYIHMLWTQRSVDLMIGLPSDIIFAAAWLHAIANEFGFRVGSVKFSLGDCHIYEEHTTGAVEYLRNVSLADCLSPYFAMYQAPDGDDFCNFKPDLLELSYGDTFGPIKLELKA